MQNTKSTNINTTYNFKFKFRTIPNLKSLDFGLWTLGLDLVLWVLDFGTLGFELWIFGFGLVGLESGVWIFDSGLWTLDFGLWTLACEI